MTLFLPESRQLADEEGVGIPEFPTEVILTIHFGPEDAFGAPGAARRTVIPYGTTARMSANMNEGISSVEGELLPALEFERQLDGLYTALAANQLTIKYQAESVDDVFNIAQPASLSLPALLTLRCGVFVWIKRFTIEIGGRQFNFRVGFVPGNFLVESNERMTERVVAAMEDWIKMAKGHERLFSAMHYLRQAKRLSQQSDRLALVSEVLLNLTKAYEILLTPRRDIARQRARSWGITDEQIEKGIIPLYLLRNEVDVAHASFRPLNEDERNLVLEFMDVSLGRTESFLAHIRDGVEQGQIVLEPVSGGLDSERRRLLAAVAEYVLAQRSSALRPGQLA